jgi:hypothetical protein
MSAEPVDIERLLAQEHAAVIPRRQFPTFGALKREFTVLDEDRYILAFPEIRVTVEIDRLRRHFHQLVGELTVRCDLPGAMGIDGVLSIADISVSNTSERTKRAALLAQRANTRKEIDWDRLIEEFCQRVIQASRVGKRLVDPRTVPLPSPDLQNRDRRDGALAAASHSAIWRRRFGKIVLRVIYRRPIG